MFAGAGAELGAQTCSKGRVPGEQDVLRLEPSPEDMRRGRGWGFLEAGIKDSLTQPLARSSFEEGRALPLSPGALSGSSRFP